MHRPFFAAVIDEVDSILIDEARIPRVIAGGDTGGTTLIYAGNQGAVWTYLTTDQPFGAWTERVLKSIQRKLWGDGTRT